jgi:hypothetical protein
MKWRKWNNIIHRDLGYLCFGLTIIYAISGVAVNHIHEWNPSYRIERSEISVNLSGLASGPLTEEKIFAILKACGEPGAYKSSFQPAPGIVQIFVQGNTLTVDLNSGRIQQEKVIERPLLRQMNFLHLNHAKKLWTWFADIYAVALGLLAITGLFVLRGKKGISGRGGWLTSAGILLPLFFLWLYL